MRRLEVNLQEAIQALEAKDIRVGTDLGVHTRCSLESNCPKAVELRKLLSDNNVSLEVIIEGYEAVTAPELMPWDTESFQVDGRVNLRVAGHLVGLDLTDELKSALSGRLRDKLGEIESQAAKTRALGQSLYNTYLQEIAKRRQGKVLPQLSFSQEDLIKYNIMVTSEGGRYVFLSPSTYRPEYIVSNGVRYELSTEDKKSLRREIIFKFVITRDNKFYKVTQLNLSGEHFQHYHAGQGDCWGQIQLPTEWDRSLASLDRLKILLSNALVTINRDSLMAPVPSGMPDISDLFGRATKLGREGVIEEQPEQTGTRIGQQAGTTRWGRRA